MGLNMFQSPETVFIVWSEEGLEKEDSSNVEEPNFIDFCELQYVHN